MDDYPNDDSTTGVLNVGGSVDAIMNPFNEFPVKLDSDWFRMSMEAGRTYLIESISNFEFDLDKVMRDSGSNDLVRVRLGQFDYMSGDDYATEDSREVFGSVAPNTSTASYLFTPHLTKDYFVNASNVSGLIGSYRLTASLYEVPENRGTRMLLPKTSASKHFIETSFDRDFFKVSFYKGWTYQIDLMGLDSGRGTLADPNLRIYNDQHELLLTQNNGGIGRDSRAFFVAAETGTYFASASGIGAPTGTYRIQYQVSNVADDFGRTAETNGRLLLDRNSIRRVIGRNEDSSDVDWFKVDLVAGRWYEFGYRTLAGDSTGGGIPKLYLINPGFQAIAGGDFRHGLLNRANCFGQDDNCKLFYARATETGTHYLSLKSVPGNYELFGVENAPPSIAVRPELSGFPRRGIVELVGDQSATFDQLFDLQQFPQSGQVQIYSDATFFFEGNSYSADQIHEFQASELSRIRLFANSRRGRFEVSLRGVDGRLASGWAQVSIASTISSDSLLNSGRMWDNSNTFRDTPIGEQRILSYRFSPSIPSYFADGRFSGYQTLSQGTRDAINEILAESQLAIEFEYRHNEAADIQIFAADLDSYSQGFLPGRYGFGDIVLDNEIYTNGTPEKGSEAYFHLVRALGTALGLNHVTNALSREQSVVGRNPNGVVSQDLYPTHFGPSDIDVFESVYGLGFSDQTRIKVNLLGVPEQGDFNRPIVWTPSETTISGLYAGGRVVVDLREGESSYFLSSDLKQVYHNQTARFTYTAVGSAFDDLLTGNYKANQIVGFRGNDTLRGLAGNDLLMGGAGNDLYIYETGDGHDEIQDFGIHLTGGGVDTLRIQGQFGVDQLEDDLVFYRRGGDLVIDLDLNGQYNLNHGSVTIKDMGTVKNRMEKLDLANYSSRVGVFSLPAIWNSATEEKQRFAATGETDFWGIVALPV